MHSYLNLKITLLSLEAYERGFVVRVRLWHGLVDAIDDMDRQGHSRRFMHPKLWLTVRDDLGNAYDAQALGSGGGHTFDFSPLFDGRLTPEISELQISIQRVEWMEIGNRSKASTVAMPSTPWEALVPMKDVKRTL